MESSPHRPDKPRGITSARSSSRRSRSQRSRRLAATPIAPALALSGPPLRVRVRAGTRTTACPPRRTSL
eukprot:2731648-Heterocapsa_arctica.AAC.1